MKTETLRVLLTSAQKAWDKCYPGTRYLIDSVCDADLRTVKANIDAALKELDASAA